MTPQQLATLKAHIDGDPELSALPNNSDGAFAIAVLLNQQASPDFYVWLKTGGDDAGTAWDRTSLLSGAAAADGLVQVTLLKGLEYEAQFNDGDMITFTPDGEDAFPIPVMRGRYTT